MCWTCFIKTHPSLKKLERATSQSVFSILWVCNLFIYYYYIIFILTVHLNRIRQHCCEEYARRVRVSMTSGISGYWRWMDGCLNMMSNGKQPEKDYCLNTNCHWSRIFSDRFINHLKHPQVHQRHHHQDAAIHLNFNVFLYVSIHFSWMLRCHNGNAIQTSSELSCTPLENDQC